MRHKSYSLWEKTKRLIQFRLIVPLLRSQQPPEYKARGVAVGLAWAMTPLVGIQMTTVFITWVIAKKIFRWGFSLPLGLAWTWVTNVITMIPVYYVFYLTGQILRGKIHAISGYENLSNIIRETFLGDLSFVDQWLLFFKLLLQDWGVSMAIGCIPWAVVMAGSGYYLTIRFEQKRLARRQQKLLLKEQRRNG